MTDLNPKMGDIKEGFPFPQELITRARELTKDVIINHDEPIEDKDDRLKADYRE